MLRYRQPTIFRATYCLVLQTTLQNGGQLNLAPSITKRTYQELPNPNCLRQPECLTSSRWPVTKYTQKTSSTYTRAANFTRYRHCAFDEE